MKKSIARSISLTHNSASKRLVLGTGITLCLAFGSFPLMPTTAVAKRSSDALDPIARSSRSSLHAAKSIDS
jgi:hypothetical protein